MYQVNLLVTGKVQGVSYRRFTKTWADHFNLKGWCRNTDTDQVEITAEGSKEDMLKKACMAFERNLILKTMEKAKWNRKKTARILGIPLSTLKYKMTQLNIYETIRTKI